MSWATKFWTRKADRLLPGYLWKKQGHHQAVLPRLCVQSAHLAMGIDSGDHEHHLYLLRRVRVPRRPTTRGPQGARPAPIWPGAAQELQHTTSSWGAVGCQQFSTASMPSILPPTAMSTPWQDQLYAGTTRADQLGRGAAGSLTASFGQAMAICPADVHRHCGT